MIKDNLKIELRAVPYGSYSKVLEYRISPNQDNLEYEEEKSYLFGLIKRKVKKKIDTNWKRPTVFLYNLTSDLYKFNDQFNWGPIYCDNQQVLNNYKNKFRTYKDIKEYLIDHTEKAYKYWKSNRDHYLKSREPLY